MLAIAEAADRPIGETPSPYILRGPARSSEQVSRMGRTIENDSVDAQEGRAAAVRISAVGSPRVSRQPGRRQDREDVILKGP